MANETYPADTFPRRLFTGDSYLRQAVTANLCATLLLIMILVKLGSFMFYHDDVMKLIRFAERNFWTIVYDEVGTRILEQYDKLGMTMTYTFTFIVSVAAFNYIFAPFFGTVFALAASAASATILLACEATRRSGQKQIIWFFCP